MWRKWRFILLLWLSSASIAYANASLDELTPEQAFQQGTLLYQQNKYDQAKPLIKYAADNNNSTASVMYATMFFSSTYIQSPEEHEYVTKAANLGNIFAMVAASSRRALSDGEYWRNKVTPILERRAEQNDGLGMRLLYVLSIFQDKAEALNWLEQAAEAGDAFSQHELARRYEDGHSWFIIPGKREKEIERLFKAAADSGYRPAMLDYTYRLQSRGDIEEYQTIIDTLLEQGDAATIHSLASDYRVAGEYQLSAYYYKVHIDSIGYEGDKVNYETVRSLFAEVRKNLTAEQIIEIEQKVKEYLKTHTVHYQKSIKDYEYTLDSIKQAKP